MQIKINSESSTHIQCQSNTRQLVINGISPIEINGDPVLIMVNPWMYHSKGKNSANIENIYVKEATFPIYVDLYKPFIDMGYKDLEIQTIELTYSSPADKSDYEIVIDYSLEK